MGGGGDSGVNFGHLKSEVFRNGGGRAFWSEIPERGFLENLDKNLLFSQKPACASQIVSHILRMWRLIMDQYLYKKHFMVIATSLEFLNIYTVQILKVRVVTTLTDLSTDRMSGAQQ